MRLKRVLCLALLLCLAVQVFPAVRQDAEASVKYYITVDLTNQIVTVYDNGNTAESGIVRQMICSSGKAGTPTPTGTFTLPRKTYSSERTEWYYFPRFTCYAKWATRIVGGILFHSVIYTAAKAGPTKSSLKALGGPASHGCIRLRVADAKWVAENCPAGTRCRIYKSGAVNSDLRKRLLDKSFIRSNETYDHFMGRGGNLEDPYVTLTKGLRGTRVKKLQKRLKALGFLDDSADGIFGDRTETAVKRFQAASGKSQTGKVKKSLWKKIFADNAPTGTYVALSKGMEGPAVKALQKALITLKLMSGSASGSYTGKTVKAVKLYQRYFAGSETGKADSDLQKDILARAKDVKSRFGKKKYQLVTADEDVSMAKVKGASKVTLRAKAKSGSKSLGKLKKKTKVQVLKKSKSWTKVQYKDKTGYIKNKYLSYYTDTRTVASYQAEVAATPTPTPTATPEIFIPTPSPEATATPEIFIPSPEATSAPEWNFLVAAPGEATAETDPDAAPQSAFEPGDEVEAPPVATDGVDGAGLEIETEPVQPEVEEIEGEL